MFHPNQIVTETDIRELERQQAVLRHLAPRRRQRDLRHPHLHAAINVTIALAATVALGALAIHGYSV
jgi:hypothetical protein